MLWWERWQLWEVAKTSAEANQHRLMNAPRDKDGAPNWAEWAKKYPGLDRAANWALTNDDTD